MIDLDCPHLIGLQGKGTVSIPRQIDLKFRSALIRSAMEVSPKVHNAIMNALEAGPSKNGVQEAVRYFGHSINQVLGEVRPLIDRIDYGFPGFKKWLELSGFGNDPKLIAALHEWVGAKNVQRLQ